MKKCYSEDDNKENGYQQWNKHVSYVQTKTKYQWSK